MPPALNKLLEGLKQCGMMPSVQGAPIATGSSGTISAFPQNIPVVAAGQQVVDPTAMISNMMPVNNEFFSFGFLSLDYIFIMVKIVSGNEVIQIPSVFVALIVPKSNLADAIYSYWLRGFYNMLKERWIVSYNIYFVVVVLLNLLFCIIAPSFSDMLNTKWNVLC